MLVAVWCSEEMFCLVCACECGGKRILLGVVFAVKVGLVVVWGVVFCELCNVCG